MNNVGVVELVDTDQWGKAVNKSVGQQNAGSSPASDKLDWGNKGVYKL